MKSNHSDLNQRYLILFKIDATNLFDRISTRSGDYIDSFSLKRNRYVFKEVFTSRYQQASIEDLAHCTVEVIEVLNIFHTEVDRLFWYLKMTQDMPNTIEEKVLRHVAKIRELYHQVLLFIDAELSGEGPLMGVGDHDIDEPLELAGEDDSRYEEYIQDTYEEDEENFYSDDDDKETF